MLKSADNPNNKATNIIDSYPESYENSSLKYHTELVLPTNDSMSSSSTSPQLSPISSATCLQQRQQMVSNVLNSNMNKLNKMADQFTSYTNNYSSIQKNLFYNTAGQQIPFTQTNNENYPFHLLNQQQTSLNPNHNFNPYSNQMFQPTRNSLMSTSDRSSIGSSLNSSNDSSNSPPNQRQVPYDTQMQVPNPSYPIVDSNPPEKVCGINNQINGTLPPKKRRNIPQDAKDIQYWEKRRKNNESAKRSRDNRRSKEDRMVMRNFYLEQENLQLKTQVALYEAEIEKLRCIAYGLGGSSTTQH